MKMIARKIAMIMILLILANSFISCFSYGAIKNHKPVWLFLTIPLDIATFVFQLIGLGLEAPIFDWGDELFSFNETRSQIYLANVENNSLTELYFFLEKIYYNLSETELDSIKQNLNSIPKTERDSTMKKIFSLHEEKIASLIRTYKSLPEREIILSIKRINSLPETELVSLLQGFNSLSKEELHSLIESLESMAEKENVVLMENLSPLTKSDYVANVELSEKGF